jgi:L-asparaginase
MSRIALIATGGTIQNAPDGRVSADDVLVTLRTTRAEPRVPDDLEIVVEEVLRKGAEDILPADWTAIARAVQREADNADVTGIVVTHGTFTAEETAYLLHLSVRTRKPIVFAVAQRKHGTLGADGERNLSDALRVALSVEARGRGVLLVNGDEIHSARDFVKLHRRPSGFDSGVAGLVGTVDVDGVSLWRSPLRRHTFQSQFGVELIELLPRVDIVAVHAGADSVATDAFVAAGARGLVTAGFAYTGIGAPEQRDALHRAALAGAAVVHASRGRGGRMPPSAENDWALRAHDLPPQKARILLALGLAAGLDHAGLQRAFDEY